MSPWMQDRRLLFGLCCLALAAVLLVILGLRRLGRWRRRRRRPDLRQRGGGESYAGSRKRRGEKPGLPCSGLIRYRGSRRHRGGRVRPILQPPSYKGRRKGR